MKRRVAAAIAGLAIVGLVLIRAAGPGAARSGPPRAVSVHPEAAAVPAPPFIPPAIPERDLFQYAPRPRPAPASPTSTPPTASGTTAPTPPAIRLVGLVRKPGRLEAALAFGGQVVIVGAGGEAGGYTVLSVDEDAGVRLRGPDGAELSLMLPPG